MRITDVSTLPMTKHPTGFRANVPSAVTDSGISSGDAIPAMALNTLKPLSVVRFRNLDSFRYGPEQNILFSLKRRAMEAPDAVALEMAPQFRNPQESIPVFTNGELYDKSLRVARLLKERFNIKPGDRVAAIETNSPEFFTLMYGTMALGASIVPLNLASLADPLSARKVLAHMLRVAQPKALFLGNIVDSNPTFSSLKDLKKLSPYLNPSFKHLVLKSILPPLGSVSKKAA